MAKGQDPKSQEERLKELGTFSLKRQLRSNPISEGALRRVQWICSHLVCRLGLRQMGLNYSKRSCNKILGRTLHSGTK